jgi:23S rRNA pseudouridine1911/1915/1917 synthase
LMTPVLRDAINHFNRQALHAIKLGLIHPVTGEAMEWQNELPDDMKALLEAMRHEETEEIEPFHFLPESEPYEYDESDEDWEDEAWDGEEDFDEE